MTKTKGSIRDRDARSASDKVLKNNLGKVNQARLSEAFGKWDPETIELARVYREKFGKMDDETWSQHLKNLERIKKKKADAKNIRVIDWD